MEKSNWNWPFAVQMAVFCAAVFVVGGVATWISLNWPTEAKARPDDRRPDLIRDGLEVHRWYRTTARLGFSHSTRAWTPQGKIGIMPAGTLVYTVERRGTVTVARGAVHGIILIPDGESVQWFRPVGTGDVGELGELEFGELPP
jgi:hypothetical protein